MINIYDYCAVNWEATSDNIRSVSDIAEEVGFKDYRVFTKVFKKRESVPPSQYHKYITDIVNAE